MKSYFVVPIIIASLLFSGCSRGPEEKEITNTRDLSTENMLTLEQATLLAEEFKLPSIVSLPREEIYQNRNQGDPIEFVRSTDSTTKETIMIGIFATSEDAVEGEELTRAKIEAKNDSVRDELTKYERVCNSTFYYYPGNDLAEPKIRESGAKLLKKWKKLCAK